MSELVIEPFINHLSQKIEPGEEVLFIASSYRNTVIRKGIFKGVRYDNVFKESYSRDSNGKIVKEETISNEIVSVIVEMVYRGEKFHWITLPNGKKDYVTTGEKLFGTSTLNLKRVYKYNTPLSDMLNMYF